MNESVCTSYIMEKEVVDGGGKGNDGKVKGINGQDQSIQIIGNIL